MEYDWLPLIGKPVQVFLISQSWDNVASMYDHLFITGCSQNIET